VESGAFKPSLSSLSHADELLTFDNSVAAFNKSASATYFYYQNAWRKVGLPLSVDVGTSNVFQPGSGVVIRKQAGADSQIWVNIPW
jgi:uncharacterized protein (TIGR02597 family)